MVSAVRTSNKGYKILFLSKCYKLPYFFAFLLISILLAVYLQFSPICYEHKIASCCHSQPDMVEVVASLYDFNNSIYYLQSPQTT